MWVQIPLGTRRQVTILHSTSPWNWLVLAWLKYFYIFFLCPRKKMTHVYVVISDFLTGNATIPLWLSQDHRVWRVYQASPAGSEHQDFQDHPVCLDLKVNQALLELDHQDNQDSRYSNSCHIMMPDWPIKKPLWLWWSSIHPVTMITGLICRTFSGCLKSVQVQSAYLIKFMCLVGRTRSTRFPRKSWT